MVAETYDGLVADGINGWSLEDYTWDPKTGIGRYQYERKLEDGTIEGHIVGKAQPYHPSHTGWYTGALRF